MVLFWSLIDKYELIEKNQIIQTEIETCNVRLYDEPALLVDMLKEIGFREIKTLKAFDVTSPSGMDDASIVYECRK